MDTKKKLYSDMSEEHGRLCKAILDLLNGAPPFMAESVLNIVRMELRL